jgi:hypothetical protein
MPWKDVPMMDKRIRFVARLFKWLVYVENSAFPARLDTRFLTGTKSVGSRQSQTDRAGRTAMVEANHAWFVHNRRLKCDYERDPPQALAFNQIAALKNFSCQVVPALKRS